MHEEQWKTMLEGVFFGMLGGLVNGFRKKSIQDWGQATVVLITAGFSGMIFQLFTSWLGVGLELQFALSGMAGYSGGMILDDAVKRLREIINKGGDAIVKEIEKKK